MTDKSYRWRQGPPETPRRPVEDILHGQSIIDPYRWLEDDRSAEVSEWTAKQNLYTENYLDALPERAEFRRELADILGGGIVVATSLRGQTVFYTYRHPGQDQPVLMARHLEEGSEPQVLVDPNAESDEGTVSLDWWYASPTGTMVAYGLSRDGDEWSTLHVVNVGTKKLLEDRIPRTRYSSIAWDTDEKGFTYTRYPQPGEVPAGDENYFRWVYHHRLGSDHQSDPLIFGEGRAKEEMLGISRSDDGRYLGLSIYHGWLRSDIYARKIGHGDFTPIITGKDALFHGRIVGDTIYILTNYQAPKYRVIAVDMSDTREESWTEIIPERSDLILSDMTIAGGRILLSAMSDASSRVYIHEMDGSPVAEIDLPALGTVSSLVGEAGNPTALLSFESFAISPTVYKVDMRTGEMTQWLQSESIIDPASIEIRQVFYPSKDSTRIPMFILHRPGLTLNGKTPTILRGYGGFTHSLTPTYSPGFYPWINAGGISAIANIRGGSEYGETWHRAGMRENKQNVFDDFIAAGEYLIQEGYTDCEHLGIAGGSNGGLLVGAVMVQRPDLMRAVLCAVPLLDMLRFHKFLIAQLWTGEYGSPDEADAFGWLRQYSPYHNVKEGTVYPAVYFHTAASDSRVHPLHARKMAALIQHATAAEQTQRPVFLSVETAAGHGAGKPLSKRIEELSSTIAFMADQLGLHNKAP